MEISQLRYFCAVADTGSFTRGARKEHVAQSSLSRQILKLEKELDTRLLDRLGRKTILTESGKVFLHWAKTILNQINEAKIEIEGTKALDQAMITVGAIPTVAPYVLPSVVSSFRRQYPSLEVRVVEGLQMNLIEGMHNAVVDFALIQTPLPGKEFEVEELICERLFVVVPEDHPLASRKSVGLDQLREDRFIVLREGFQFRKTVLETLRHANIRPNIVFEALSFKSILAMVSAGLGVAVLPEMALEKIKGCCFVPLEAPSKFYQVGLVRLRRHHLSRVHWQFIQHLRNGARGGARQ